MKSIISPWRRRINHFYFLLLFSFLYSFSIQAQTYCTPQGTNSSRFINNFSTSGGLQNITNNGSGFSPGGYGVFTGLTVGQEQNASVNFSADFVGGTYGFRIWVDWNQNGTFEASEAVYSSSSYENSHTGSFSVPNNAALGPTRMRIVAHWLSSSADINSCETGFTYGEFEDYTFNVIALDDCTGTPSGGTPTTASISTCPNLPFNLNSTGYSAGYNGLSGVWQSSPAGANTWADVPGSQNQPNFNITTGITADMDYRYTVYCSFSNQTGYSSIITVTIDCNLDTPGCPDVNVDPGSLTINANNIVIPCGDNTAVLTADYLKTGGTETYRVESIGYNPPFPFTSGSGSTNITSDDYWSETINLGFDFCFYGNTFNRALFSSNGAISFSIDGVVPGGRYSPSSGAGYSYTNTIPSNSTGTTLPYVNAIMGVLQDTHPTYGGDYYSDWSINYEILGAAPCRMLVVNMYKLAQFSCGTDVGPQTYQMVIYETTNAIDVYVKDRTACTTWNSGSGLIGLHNEDGSQAITPPGRNTGTWSAHNEAWRFIPDGTPNYTFAWYDAGNNLISSNDQITVGPGTYTARIVYHSCYGLDIVKEQTVTVTKESGIDLNTLTDLEACETTPGSGQANFDLTQNNSNALGTNNPSDYSVDYYNTEANAIAGGATGKLTPYNNYQSTSNPQTVWVRIQENSNPGCYDVASFQLVVNPAPNVTAGGDVTICTGTSTTLTAGGATSYTWSPATGLSATTGTSVTASPTGTQVYTVTGTDANQCSNTDQVTVTVSPEVTPTFTQIPAFCQGTTAPTLPATSTNGITGTWNPATVSNTAVGNTTYTFTPYATECATTQTMDITVNPLPTVNAGADVTICEGESTTIAATGASTYSWDNGVGSGASHSVSPTSTTTYTVTGTDGNNCVNTDQVTVTVTPQVPPTFTQISAFCEGTTAPTLPTTSTNGITGTWSPATVSNTAVGNTTYTFTPYATECATTQTMDITVNPLPTIAVTITDPTTCGGNGSIDFTFTNVADGTYTIGGFTGVIVTGGTATINTPAGTYSGLSITNQDGCISNIESATLTDPNAPDAPTFTVTDPTCTTDGFAVVSNYLSGATYTFTPVGPSVGTTGEITGASFGQNYNVEVEINGCTASASFQIEEQLASPAVPSFTVTDPTCTTVGSAQIDAYDNTLTYTIAPNTATIDASGEITGTAATYTVTVENGDGCQNTAQVVIGEELADPTIAVAITDPTTCGGNGSIDFTFTNVADGTYTIGGFTGVIVTGGTTTINTPAGTYSGLSITNQDGCTSNSESATLTDPNAPAIDAGADQVLCEGATTTLNAISPDGATVTWDNGVTDGAAFTPPVGTTTYTVTANLAGCTNSDQMTITVTPSITGLTCPGALTATCDITEQPAYADYNAFITAGGSVTIPANGAAVDPASFTLLSEVTDGNSCPEIVTRTYQIADTCGVTATCTQTITINDEIVPTASNPAPISATGTAPAPDISVVTDAADNCTTNPIVAFVGDVSDGGNCPEIVTRTYSVTDNCGNSINVEQIITLGDEINPTASNPADINVECIDDVPLPDPTVVTDAADNGGVPTVTWEDDVSDGETCQETITRRYRVTDNCGNFIFVTQMIVVNDVTNPTASNPAPVTVECLTDVPPVAVTVVTDAADNCTVNPTVAFVSESSDNNTCNGEVITRIYSVTDDCGNSINVTHTITVDSYTPTFTVSSTDPTACGASDGTITISGLNANTDYIFSYDGGANTNITTDAAGEYVITGLPAGSYTDYTVSDADCPSCNTTENVTMTLTDPNPPAIDAGADQVLCEGATTMLNAINPDGATVTWDNGVTDGAAFTPPVGTTTYTVTANLAGCTNSDQMTITVTPSITGLTCPGALTATCDITEQPAYADYNAFITAGGSVTIPANGAAVDPASFTLLSEVSDGNTCPEVVTRTYQVADTCGVTVTCTQTITINDLIAPTGTAPADLTVQCIGDVPAADVTLITDEADNCTVNPTVTHVSDVSDGNTCPEVITRTYNIADDCGNNIDVVQTITINDDTNPTGTAPADLTVQCIGDVPAADVTLITDEADNCTVNPIVTHVSDVSDGNTCPEVITRTYNIADDCGNNIDVVQTITIDDNTNPTASNPAPVTVECLTDVPPVDVSVVTDAADNCTVNPTVAFVSESSDNNTCNGEVITRIYSVTDDCGNSINVTHTITVDSYTPTFTVSSTDPTACGASDGTITISGLNANTDYIFSYDGGANTNITTDAAGEYVITGLTAGSYIDYTVSDVDCPACNTTENVTMILTDPNAPTIDAGVDQEVCEGETVTLTAVNPDGATITWDNGVTDGVGFVSPVGTTNYTVTAEIANCFSSDVVSVLVHPTPTVSAGNDVEVCDGTQVTLQGSGAATYVWDNGVTDGTPFTPSVGTITYSVVGTSAFGCEASDQVDVTVNENPEVLFEADVTEGCTPLEVNLVSLTPGAADCQFTIEGMQIDGCDINYTFTNPGCYDVNLEVESVNGCVSDLTLNNYICIDNYPIADFTVEPGQLSNMNDEATFVNGSIGAETYDWSFGDGETSTENNPIHTYSVEEDGEDAYEIQLIAYSELGCPDTAYVKLPFIEDLIYYVPNTFTPDGNKYNETFKPVFSSGFDPQDYNLKIFNRWGELIFESQNAAYGWDGTYGVDNNTIVKEGVYVWKIEFKKKYNDERIELVGHVNLLK